MVGRPGTTGGAKSEHQHGTGLNRSGQ